MQIDYSSIVSGLLGGGGGTALAFWLFVDKKINDKVAAKIKEQKTECEKRCNEHKEQSKDDIKEIKETLRLIFDRQEEQKNLIIDVIRSFPK